jgi:hypothetical protein
MVGLRVNNFMSTRLRFKGGALVMSSIGGSERTQWQVVGEWLHI